MKPLNHFFLALIMILSCLFSLRAFAADSDYRSPDNIPGSHLINAEQVIDLAGSEDDLIIIDSRISIDRRYGYIEGSISLPDQNTDCDSLSILLKKKQTPVIFYCNGPKCARSAKAVNIALSCEYKNIYWFRGGIEEWKEKNYPFVIE